MTDRLRVGIAGCGFIGRKRARALGGDTLAGGLDVDPDAAYWDAPVEDNLGGVSPRAAADLAVFLLSGDARGISGKLISAHWDDWRDPELRARLAGDPDLATVRRIDGERYRRVT